MGVVYEAYDPDLDRTVALKTISIAFAIAPTDREAFEQRFFGEARIAARLTHPGIVVVHDVGRDPGSGTLYIALERLEGHTVAELVARGQALTWREALRIAKGVAEALHYAHRHKVVHLDVKPANVMVLPSGDAKLMDFGIAHIGTTGMKLTGSGEFFGTPLFMAPEQALGQEVDARADLFALGAILYVMVTGRHAFDAPNIAAILTRVISGEPTPPSHLVANLPTGIDAIVARALTKTRESRDADGQTMADDLADVLALSDLGADPLAGSAAEAESRTTPSQTDCDVQAALDRLVAPALSGPSTVSEITRALERSVAPRTTVASTSPRGDGRSPERSRVMRWGLGFGGVLVVGLIAVVYVSRDGADAVPTTPSTPVPAAEAGPLVSGRGRNAPVARARDAPRAQSSAPSAAGSAPAADAAFVAFDFEHPLRTGRLRIWADEEMIFDGTVDGRVDKRILSLKLRKGVVTATVPLTPGRHQIRVQVLWDDNERMEAITGTFTAGVTRQLEIRLGRLRKDLSLEWK